MIPSMEVREQPHFSNLFVADRYNHRIVKLDFGYYLYSQVDTVGVDFGYYLYEAGGHGRARFLSVRSRSWTRQFSCVCLSSAVLGAGQFHSRNSEVMEESKSAWGREESTQTPMRTAQNPDTGLLIESLGDAD